MPQCLNHKARKCILSGKLMCRYRSAKENFVKLKNRHGPPKNTTPKSSDVGTGVLCLLFSLAYTSELSLHSLQCFLSHGTLSSTATHP